MFALKFIWYRTVFCVNCPTQHFAFLISQICQINILFFFLQWTTDVVSYLSHLVMMFMSSSACSNTQRSKVTFDHTYVRDRANITPPPPEKEEKAACTVQRCRSSVLLCVFLNFKIMMRFTYLKWGSSQYYTTATNKQSSWPFFLCMTVNRKLVLLVFWCFSFYLGSFSTECWYTRPFSIFSAF